MSEIKIMYVCMICYKQLEKYQNLSDSTLFNDVQSVSHKEIAVKKQQVSKTSTSNNVTA